MQNFKSWPDQRQQWSSSAYCSQRSSVLHCSLPAPDKHASLQSRGTVRRDKSSGWSPVLQTKRHKSLLQLDLLMETCPPARQTRPSRPLTRLLALRQKFATEALVLAPLALAPSRLLTLPMQGLAQDWASWPVYQRVCLPADAAFGARLAAASAGLTSTGESACQPETPGSLPAQVCFGPTRPEGAAIAAPTFEHFVASMALTGPACRRPAGRTGA